MVEPAAPMTSRDGNGASGGRSVLLLVAADPELERLFQQELSAYYEVLHAIDGTQARQLAAAREVSLAVIYDAVGAGEQPFELREALVASRPDLPVILIAALGSEERAVEALKRGFTDYMVMRHGTLQADLFRKRIANNLELARLKRDNEALRQSIEESQARLFNVYDSLDDVIMQIDGDCRVVSLNRSAAALANCEPREAVGKVCHALFDFYPCEARAKKESCHIYRTFLEDETIRGEREDPKTRSVYQFMTFITTLKDRDYTVYRETDITEKRRLEQKIARALESLGVKPVGADGATPGSGEAP